MTQFAGPLRWIYPEAEDTTPKPSRAAELRP
jgi:hypothetical protein